jgi:hypothetical protein
MDETYLNPETNTWRQYQKHHFLFQLMDKSSDIHSLNNYGSFENKQQEQCIMIGASPFT